MNEVIAAALGRPIDVEAAPRGSVAPPCPRPGSARPCHEVLRAGARVGVAGPGRLRARARVTPRFPDTPDRVEKRTIADLAEWPYPRQQLVPAHRGGPRPSQRRALPGLHPRLPVLPGRDDHPPGAGATRRAGAHHGIGRPGPHRLRRGGPRPPSRAPTTRASRRRSPRSSTTLPARDRCRSASPASGWMPSPSRTAAQIQRVRRHRSDLRSRGRHLADAPGDQQADPRRGSLRRGRCRLQPGVEAGQALLPDRPPTETDEDTLGIVNLAKQCVAIGRRYHKGVTVTASVGGFVPKVQTPFQWFGQNTIEELTREGPSPPRHGPSGAGPHHPLARPQGHRDRGW